MGTFYLGCILVVLGISTIGISMQKKPTTHKLPSSCKIGLLLAILGFIVCLTSAVIESL